MRVREGAFKFDVHVKIALLALSVNLLLQMSMEKRTHFVLNTHENEAATHLVVLAWTVRLVLNSKQAIVTNKGVLNSYVLRMPKSVAAIKN
jgi:hypothetical protein